MPGHECYHCKQWVEAGEPHDCWTTTEAALTRDLPEDLREAWERLRETAAALGEQRIYASHHCIMFARKACYFFVRPKPRVLEIVFFLGRHVRAPQIRRAEPASTRKIAHFVHVRHRDEVEPPLTDWLREAYETSDALSGRGPKKPAAKKAKRVSSAKKAPSRAARERRVTSRSSARRPPRRSRTGAG
ncbi:MAG TPA: DUF5655 domain-containing protein [Vicinamibacterales bacterium]|nr:DUF5655 domain-containing protein [Vicinamibacterales bacterium]